MKITYVLYYIRYLNEVMGMSYYEMAAFVFLISSMIQVKFHFELSHHLLNGWSSSVIDCCHYPLQNEQQTHEFLPQKTHF